LLHSFFKFSPKPRLGDQLEKLQHTERFEKALKQCQETIERFEGSEETLRYIRRVEESLKRIIAETN